MNFIVDWMLLGLACALGFAAGWRLRGATADMVRADCDRRWKGSDEP